MHNIKGYEFKKCFYCGSRITKKNGFSKGIQRFKCAACDRQFNGGLRMSNKELWNEYVHAKLTYSQLANKSNCTVKTVQRNIDKYSVSNTLMTACKVVVTMDTTYWGRGFGVMLFKDATKKINLLKYYVKNESNKKYIEGIKALQTQGFIIQAIVCDGRKGIIQSFGQIPVQMCQFHQVAIIQRYLTKKQNYKHQRSCWKLWL